MFGRVFFLTAKAVLVVVALLISGTLHAAYPVAASVKALPMTARTAVSGVIGEHESAYRIQHSTQPNAVLFAANPNQHLISTFGKSGVWVGVNDRQRWGMRFAGLGYGVAQRIESVLPRIAPAHPNRVEYRHSRMTEWYVNGPMGLQQGFTINRRPTLSSVYQARPALILGLQLLKAQVEHVASDTVVIQPDDGPAFSYGGLVVYDATGKEQPASFEKNGGDHLRLVIDDSAAVYPLTIDPVIAQQARLQGSNTESGDQFGIAVSISGDTLVVGAKDEESNAVGVNGNGDDNSALSSGAAYVFVRNGVSWTQQAYLKASNAEETDYFGWSVAISGDTVVIGAPWEDSNATTVNGDESNNDAPRSGAAYVFVRDSNGAWAQQAYLKAANAGAGDRFGRAVAIDGDTIVVGAHEEASNATGVNGDGSNNSGYLNGAAYVFVRNGSSWSQQAYLKASNSGAGDHFGRAVAISGDTVVVGARWELSNATGVNGDGSDNSAYKAGAAYVFVRNGSSWTQQAYLKASNTDANDEFGHTVAVNGDTVVVGADLEASNATGINGDQSDNSASESGAVYVFVRSGTSWSQQAYLKASNAEAHEFFGSAVSIDNDKLIVGAWAEDSNATGVNGDQTNNSFNSSGAAYFFTRSGTNWTQQAYLKASDPDIAARFGESLDASGNYLVVGAGGKTAAYVFNLGAAAFTVQAVAGEGGSLDASTPSPQTVGEGDTISFSFNADTGYYVAGISGCGVNYANSDQTLQSKTVQTGQITQDCSVVASFAHKQYVVLANASDNGSVDPATQLVNEGAMASFTVTHNVGYHANDPAGDCPAGGWSGNVYTTGAISSPCNMSFSFSLNTYTISTSAPPSQGSITPASRVVTHGDDAFFDVNANPGYSVFDVTGCNGTWRSADHLYSTGAITADCTIIATFTTNTYTVSTSAPASEGTITPVSQSIAYGNTVSLQIEAKPGYLIDKVTGCGGTWSGANPYVTAPVTADCTVTATFKADTSSSDECDFFVIPAKNGKTVIFCM